MNSNSMLGGAALFVVLAGLSCSATSIASAQVRATLNQGFEVPTKDSLDPVTEIYQDFGVAYAIPQSLMPGWNSTHSPNCFGEPCIEVWDTGLAATGSQYIELDAYEPSAAILEDVCLINGETLEWIFYHRNRGGGPDEVQMQINSGDQILANQNTASTTVWAQNASSAVVTVPTGLHDIQFVSILPGGNNSSGNFLDDITIILPPLLEFDLAGFSDFEGGSGNPQIRISGTVAAGGINIPISSSPITASASEFSVPSSIFIPEGIYPNTLIDIPITLNEDTDIEGDETFEVTIGTGPGYEIAPVECTATPPISSAIYTILDNDARLTLEKELSGGSITDETLWTLSFDGGAGGTGSGVEGDSAVTSAEVEAGSFSLSETQTEPNYFLNDLTCSGATDTSATSTNPVIDILPGELVTCVFSNRFRNRDFSIDKTVSAGPTIANGTYPTFMDAGDTITYDVTIENTGTGNLNLTLTESLPGASIVCPSSGGATISSLGSGDTEVCEVVYTLTQADFDTNGDGDGDIDNTIIATFGANSRSASEEVPIVQVSDIEIVKSADTAGPLSVGDAIFYEFEVTNIGNVTLYDVDVEDVSNGNNLITEPSNEGLSTAGGVAVSPLTTDATTDGVWDVLGVGDSVTFSTNYTVVQEDIDTLQ